MRTRYVVAVGASAGGVAAMLDLADALPPDFPAPICVVLHVGANSSSLPELLGRRGRTAVHPASGTPLQPGVYYIAPPDHHMVVDDGVVQLHRGPKENHSRPAIDPLFRSVALSRRESAVGVVLTGMLDDGSAGLRAIKDCGGITCVEDPATAFAPDMPANAMLATHVDHCLPLAALALQLVRIVSSPRDTVLAGAPPRLVHENAAHLGPDIVSNLERIGLPSTFTCPDCGGALWEVAEGGPLRWRCHTGHAFSAAALTDSQARATDEALWSAVRALHEREMLLRRMASVADATGDDNQARVNRVEAERLASHVKVLASLSKSIGNPDSSSA